SFVCEAAYSIVGKQIITRAGETPSQLLPGREQTNFAPNAVPLLGGVGGGFVSPVKVLALSLTAGTAANLLIDGRTTLAAAGGLPAQAWLQILGLALICITFGYSFWFLA